MANYRKIRKGDWIYLERKVREWPFEKWEPIEAFSYLTKSHLQAAIYPVSHHQEATALFKEGFRGVETYRGFKFAPSVERIIGEGYVVRFYTLEAVLEADTREEMMHKIDKWLDEEYHDEYKEV